MRKWSGLVVLAFMLLAMPSVYADDVMSNFNDQLLAVQTHRAMIEAKLGLKPNEDSYDVADHYMGDHMMHQVPEDLGVWVG